MSVVVSDYASFLWIGYEGMDGHLRGFKWVSGGCLDSRAYGSRFLGVFSFFFSPGNEGF